LSFIASPVSSGRRGARASHVAQAAAPSLFCSTSLQNPKPAAMAARSAIAAAYLTMPTVFIVAPRSASDFAMNLAKSSGPA